MPEPITIITTRRLRLRTWLPSDAPSYRAGCNTPQVMQYLGGVVSARAIRAEIAWYRWHQAKHGFTFWAIERRYDKALLGFAGIIRVPERGSPLQDRLEIGWRIRAQSWRRGYAFEAAAAVVEWAQWELSGERLYARIHRENKASQGLARKLGMRRARAMERKQARLEPELHVFRMKL